MIAVKDTQPHISNLIVYHMPAFLTLYWQILFGVSCCTCSTRLIQFLYTSLLSRLLLLLMFLTKHGQIILHHHHDCPSLSQQLMDSNYRLALLKCFLVFIFELLNGVISFHKVVSIP